MTNILIHWNYGRTSMMKVQDLMKNDCTLIAKTNGGKWYYRKKNGNWNKCITPIGNIKNGNTINWGNHILKEDEWFKINKPSSILFCVNKALSRKILQDNNIGVPVTWYDYNEARLPFIARPMFHHKGKEFYVIDSMEKYREFTPQQGMYYSSIFNKTNEYRIHCAHGKVLLINEKPLSDTDIRANQAITHQAWKYIKWGDYRPLLCNQALMACKVLGLDCGAVDIMYNKDTHECAICEINTAPTLCDSEYNSKRHAMYFDWLINNEFKEHYDFSNWKKGSSYAWKNEQLGEKTGESNL